jgi:Insertion element 4 transposase N-terminal
MRRSPFGAVPPADEGAFDRLRESINPEWIEGALEATGTATIRRRRLPAEQVIWLVLGMAIYRQLAGYGLRFDGEECRRAGSPDWATSR